MDVRCGKRVGEEFAQLVAHEQHLLHLEQPREPLQLVPSRTAPDQDDAEIVQVAKERGGPNQRIEVLRVPDVPRVHDHELVGKTVLASPGVVAWARLQI